MQSNTIVSAYNIHRTLSHDRQELRILRGISFNVDEGEWVAISGPSGSGKSTLLGILAGIDRPTTGSVMLDGTVINTLSEGKLARIRNEKIGVVFQAFHLIPTLTALENVAAPLYISPRHKNAKALACRMLGEVGLADRLDHLPHQLSGGEQQRVAIARALVNEPRVLLADEPTGNLDSATSRQVLSIIRMLKVQFRLTVIMVTHDPNVASYADRQLHVVDGRLTDNLPDGAPLPVLKAAAVEA